jgi:hypothetical protein
MKPHRPSSLRPQPRCRRLRRRLRRCRAEELRHHVTSQQPPPQSNVIDFPKEIGAPCMTRTCDLLVRSQTLYPTELRALGG